MEFNFNQDTPGCFTSVLCIFDILNTLQVQWLAPCFGELNGKCLVMMMYLSVVITLINREGLQLFWSIMTLPVNHCSPKGSAVGFHGIFPTGSLSSSLPLRATCAVWGRKSPLFLFPPSSGWKDIRVSRAEPRPEIPAGQTGSRCRLLFSTLYLPFPCLEFGDQNPQVIESMRVI